MTNAFPPCARLLRAFLALCGLLLAGAVAAASPAPFVFWNHTSYGETGFSEGICDTDGDAAGNFYELITHRDVKGQPKLALMRFNLAQTQEFVTGLGYAGVFNAKLTVSPEGDSFAVGYELPTDGIRYIRVSRVKSSGALAWTRVVAKAASGPSLSLRRDASGGLVLAVIESGTAPQAQLIRLDADSGAFRWARTIPGSHTAMATGGSAILLAEQGADVRLRAFSVTSGTLQWERTFDFGGSDSLGALEFNASRNSFAATGRTVSTSTQPFVTRFSSSGSRTWTRYGGAGSIDYSTIRFGPDGDLFHLVFVQGFGFHLERLKDSGALQYSTPIPEAYTLWSGYSDLLSVDPKGVAYYARREVGDQVTDGKARIARVSATGQLDWQLVEGPPYWDTSREWAFTIKGILAPPNSQSPLRLAVVSMENQPDTTYDLRTYFYGPPF